MMIKAVIFDLDGTLLDTLEDLTDSVNYVLQKHGMPQRTIKEIRSFIGNGVPTLIARSVPENTDSETIKICIAEMLEYYSAHAEIKTKPYDGIAELLKELENRNVLTAVVTNKAEIPANILCKAKFGDIFTLVIGDNGIDRLKPEPDNVFRAMNELKINKEEALYVGDSDVDMLTATRAGLKSVGVTWGFRDEATLRQSGADFIINAPDELLNIINIKKI